MLLLSDSLQLVPSSLRSCAGSTGLAVDCLLGVSPQQHPLVRGPRGLGAALLTVAGQDVAVGGREPHAPRAAQPHGLQLGGLRAAAVAAGAEGLLQDGAEGNHGLRARGLAAAAFAASQQHHLPRETQR